MQVVEECRQVLQMAVLAVDRFALSITSHIVAEDAEAIREKGELVAPLTAVGHAGMNHHERRPLAGNLVVDESIVDGHKASVTSVLGHSDPTSRAQSSPGRLLPA